MQEELLPNLNQSSENWAKVKDKDEWLDEVRGNETHWTPITGEESLPKDDEALCLFAEWEGDLMKDRWIVKWKVAKTDISHHHFTHYTILTKPKQ